jgi:hypothetical protein
MPPQSHNTQTWQFFGAKCDGACSTAVLLGCATSKRTPGLFFEDPPVCEFPCQMSGGEPKEEFAEDFDRLQWLRNKGGALLDATPAGAILAPSGLVEWRCVQ